MKRITFLLLMCFYLHVAYANVQEQYIFGNDEQATRFKQLSHDLRCLVCQNQDLIASQAPLAVDLRQRIAKQIQQGQSDEQIKAELVARYGDFILYKPAVRGVSLVLWLAPLVLLLMGIAVVLAVVRRATVTGKNDKKMADKSC